MIAAQNRARLEAFVSGAGVFALFAWFVLGACGFAEKGPPPPPPPQSTDTAYDGFSVVEGPTFIDFGGLYCDPQGHYSGGGDASTEDRVRNGIKGSVEKARDELKDIDQRLDKCKAKRRSDKDIEASFGCDRTQAGAARIRLENKEWELAKTTKDYDDNKNAIWTVPGATLKTRTGPDGWPVVVPDPEGDREFEERERDRQQYVKGLEQRIAAIKQEIPPLKADYEAKQAPCDQAAAAKANDPCSDQNMDALKSHREALRVQAASHQYRLDKFNNCMDDRKRKAGGGAPTGSTVAPAIMQTVPGILGGIRSRPSSPRPSDPGQRHGH